MRAVLLAALLASLLSACIDERPEDDTGGPPASGPAPAPEVSGTYDTKVELIRTTCSGIQVEDRPTTLDQAGASITLTHGPLTYTGSVDDLGNFTTEPQEVEVGPDTHRLAVAGAIHDKRLVAVVTAHVSGSRPCRYSVAWKGAER